MILIHTLRSRWIFWAICGIVVAWAVAAVGLIPSQCRPTPWVMGPTNDDTCLDQYTAQIGLKVVDILTDVALAVLPGILFMGVQMKRSKRIVVAFLFGIRIMYDASFSLIALQSLIQFSERPSLPRSRSSPSVTFTTPPPPTDPSKPPMYHCGLASQQVHHSRPLASLRSGAS